LATTGDEDLQQVARLPRLPFARRDDRAVTHHGETPERLDRERDRNVRRRRRQEAGRRTRRLNACRSQDLLRSLALLGGDRRRIDRRERKHATRFGLLLAETSTKAECFAA